MLSLHLEKSHAILKGRLRFIRYSLVGQKPPRATRLIRTPQQQAAFLSRANKLAQKYAPKPVPVVKPKVFAFPEIHRREEEPQEPIFTQVKVVKKGRSLRTTLFLTMMGISLTLLLLLFGPMVYFRFFTHEVVPVQTQETGTPLGGDF